MKTKTKILTQIDWIIHTISELSGQFKPNDPCNIFGLLNVSIAALIIVHAMTVIMVKEVFGKGGDENGKQALLLTGILQRKQKTS